MPPTMDAFFALLLAIPLYLNLWLARPWNGIGGGERDARATATRDQPVRG